METNNLSLNEQLILMLTQEFVRTYGFQSFDRDEIGIIRSTAKKLSQGFPDTKPENKKPTISLDTKLVDCGIVHSCLVFNKIITVGDLIQYTPNQLLRLRNFGKTSLYKVEKFLKKFNLKLKSV